MTEVKELADCQRTGLVVMNIKAMTFVVPGVRPLLTTFEIEKTGNGGAQCRCQALVR